MLLNGGALNTTELNGADGGSGSPAIAFGIAYAHQMIVSGTASVDYSHVPKANGIAYSFQTIVSGVAKEKPRFIAVGNAYGFQSQVKGYGGAAAVAYGFQAQAKGSAVGYDAAHGKAYGFQTIVKGTAYKAGQAKAVAYGFQSVAKGYGGAVGVAYGFQSVVSGTAVKQSLAHGIAYGFQAVAKGAATSVSYANGNAYGFQALAKGYSGAVSVAYGFQAAVSGYVISTNSDGSVGSINATAMNTLTGECTTYSNYPFKRIVQVAGKNYGIKDDGFYLLDGDKDIDLSVNGIITTKETDFGSFQSKRCPYLYLDNDSLLKVTPIIDDIAKIPHLTSFNGRKCHLARGLSSRYWQFKIENIKRLGSIEYLPEIRQRRVK